MEDRDLAALAGRVSTLEDWRTLVGPMLHQLQEDQAYRARWREERARRWSKWQRWVAFAFAAAGALAVVVSSVVELVHLF